jgi:hypothetical protein
LTARSAIGTPQVRLSFPPIFVIAQAKRTAENIEVSRPTRTDSDPESASRKYRTGFRIVQGEAASEPTAATTSRWARARSMSPRWV